MYSYRLNTDSQYMCAYDNFLQLSLLFPVLYRGEI